jgi:hypothetical protein
MTEHEPAVEKKKKSKAVKVDLRQLYNNTLKEAVDANDWLKVLRTCGARKPRSKSIFRAQGRKQERIFYDDESLRPNENRGAAIVH